MYKYLNEEQRALASLMSNISEEAWAAGWMDGLEYALWYTMLHGPMKYGWEVIGEQTIQKLMDLSAQTGCWIVFDDEKRELALPVAEWQKLFEQADPAEYLHFIDL